jgi:hypothetical protein
MDNQRPQSDKQQKQSKRSVLKRKLRNRKTLLSILKRKPRNRKTLLSILKRKLCNRKTLLSMFNMGSIAYKAGKWVIENLIDFFNNF